MIRSSVALVLGLAGIAAAGVTGWQVIGNGKCCGHGCPFQSTPAEAAPQTLCAVQPQAEPEVAAQRLEVAAPQASVQAPAVVLAPLAGAPAVLPTPCVPSQCLATAAQRPVVGIPQAQLSQMERKQLARAAYVQKRMGAKLTSGAKSGANDPALLAKKQQQLGQTATVAPVAPNPKLGVLEPAKVPPAK